MVTLGVLEECTEVANSTIFVVQKTSGKWRLICDLRKYNERLTDYIVHLPSPYELINKICSSELYTYADFSDAYFQVLLSDESIKNHPIVASVSGCSKNFRFLRMAQGLRPATATFVNLTNQVYSPMSDHVSNYLDDSVIGTVNDEDIHFRKMKQFVQLTNDAGLRLSMTKCVFFAKNITFLNYTVSEGKWGLSEKQKKTIGSLNADNLNQEKRESLAAFLQHFNRFASGVSHASRKIRDSTLPIEDIKKAIEKVKAKLINSKALKSVDFVSDLHIYIDASEFDCSGCIYQKSKTGGMELVTCFSKKLPKPMLNKGIYDKELYALQQLVKTYRYLLIGSHRKIFWTDNKAVQAAEKSRAPSLRCLFDFIRASFGNVKFNYVSTKQNPADILTRQNINSVAKNKSKRNCKSKYASKTLDESLLTKVLGLHSKGGCVAAGKLHLTMAATDNFAHVTRKEIDEALTHCKDCKHIENHVLPRKSVPGITLSKEWTTQDSIYIDHKTILTTARKDKMRDKDTTDFDPTEGLETSCLTVFEPVSQQVWVYPVSNYETETVKDCLRNVFQQNGTPGSVISDNAKSFVALRPWLEKLYNTSLHHTSAYHPCSNLSERAHKEFERVLKKYDVEKGSFKYESWKDALAQCVIAMNSLRNTTYGLSPYEISKNRVISELEPLRFHPTPFEYQLRGNRFIKKADKNLNSKLKRCLPVYKRNSVVKVNIPGESVKFGTITAYKDNINEHAVKMKFPNPDGGFFPSIGISKDWICIQANEKTEDKTV